LWPAGLVQTEKRPVSLSNSLGRILRQMGADVRAPTRVCPPPHLESPMQARVAGVVTSLIPWLVSLAVLSSVPGGVQAAKPRPQHALPFFPYRWGLPPARDGHAMATAADGSVWIFGGEESNSETRKYSNELLKLDLQERRWHNVTTAGPQPSGRRDHTMTAVANGTRLLVFGGSSVPRVHGQSKCDDSWIFNVLSAEWTQLTAGATGVWPNERIGHAMAAVSDTSVLLFGGQTGADYAGYALDELWSLDVPSTNWTQLTAGATGAWPSARFGHAMVVVSDTRVLLFGGQTATGTGTERSDELWSLDVPSTIWTQLIQVGASGAWPSARRWHEMAAVSDTRVLLFDGLNLFSLDFLSADSHTVLCTRLNDETVTAANELWERFNDVQVHAANLRKK
jgi:N-acetylneuraminic acid mutarotase